MTLARQQAARPVRNPSVFCARDVSWKSKFKKMPLRVAWNDRKCTEISLRSRARLVL
jgi:hypothetical protein